MYQSGHVRYHDDLETLMRPIDSVVQHPDNYNNGDTDALVESILTNGMYRPIYVQKSTGYIIAGNHTWMACKELNATEIPVVIADLDDIQAKRILVADNRIAQLARPDDAQLIGLLEEIAAEDELRGTGYEEHDLEALRLLQEKLNNIPLGDFPEVPGDMDASHKCPSCGYEWNGSSQGGGDDF